MTIYNLIANLAGDIIPVHQAMIDHVRPVAEKAENVCVDLLAIAQYLNELDHIPELKSLIGIIETTALHIHTIYGDH